MCTQVTFDDHHDNRRTKSLFFALMHGNQNEKRTYRSAGSGSENNRKERKTMTGGGFVGKEVGNGRKIKQYSAEKAETNVCLVIASEDDFNRHIITIIIKW